MNPAEPDPPAPRRTTEHPVLEMDIPPDALVILVGPSGCGKSTFARTRFPAAPLGLCVAQQRTRARRVAADVVELHHAHMQQALAELPGEGYTHLYVVRPKS